uniref:Uncharacterized protein n=1 Tax=Lactuca sativa TaxID=4236 RepID=A0A9R1W8J4_LACSA|nr:hypothetical protein LSAT_V11C200092200 [Lactuca sativa]
MLFRFSSYDDLLKSFQPGRGTGLYTHVDEGRGFYSWLDHMWVIFPRAVAEFRSKLMREAPQRETGCKWLFSLERFRSRIFVTR